MKIRSSALLWHALQNRLPRTARGLAWLRHEIVSGVVLAPLEPMLHASQWRLAWAGLFTLIGNPLFGWIWTRVQPQPWESMRLRLAAGSLGLVLLVLAVRFDARERSAQVLFNLVWWLVMPLMFSYMYLCNGGNAVWLASATAMVLIYYHSIDWRIATLGLPLAVLVAVTVFHTFGPPVSVAALTPGQSSSNALTLGFFWAAAVVMGFSTANQRRINVRRTLTTIGIMAHELRTPLATVGLIAQALRATVAQAEPKSASAVELLAERLAAVARNMNHQIDMQVSNARLMRLSPQREPVAAARLVRDTLAAFPFRNAQEQAAVQVRVQHDFVFTSSKVLFAHVLENLLTNALRALAATDVPLRPGDIVIAVDAASGGPFGTLTVSDRGVGIDPGLQQRIFEPFYSTDNQTGNGLGLAFCKRMVKSADGRIWVRSKPGQGATFLIELPIAAPAS